MMKMKHNLGILSVCLMGLMGLAACSGQKSDTATAGGAASDPQTVAASQVADSVTLPPNAPVLRVVTDANYPPFAFKNATGQIEGLDVDMFTAVAKNQGYAVQFMPHDWEGIFTTLQKDTADVVASAVSNTDESVAAADLSNSYYHTPYRVATLASAKFDLMKDWATQPHIAISTTEDSSVDLPQRYQVKKTQLLPVESVFLALQAVAKKEAQVVVADSTVLQYYMASPTFKDNHIEFQSQNLPAGRGADIVFAVKKGNQKLLNQINVGLDNIKKSGEYKHILEKWKQSLPTQN